jgi:hypothetical protein
MRAPRDALPIRGDALPIPEDALPIPEDALRVLRASQGRFGDALRVLRASPRRLGDALRVLRASPRRLGDVLRVLRASPRRLGGAPHEGDEALRDRLRGSAVPVFALRHMNCHHCAHAMLVPRILAVAAFAGLLACGQVADSPDTSTTSDAAAGSDSRATDTTPDSGIRQAAPDSGTQGATRDSEVDAGSESGTLYTGSSRPKSNRKENCTTHSTPNSTWARFRRLR